MVPQAWLSARADELCGPWGKADQQLNMKAQPKSHPLSVGVVAGVALCTALCGTAADYSATVLSHNPLAYYRLNETTPTPVPDVATNSGTLGAAAVGYYAGSS